MGRHVSRDVLNVGSFLLCGLMLAVTSGCGGDGDSSSGQDPSSSTTASSIPSSSASSASSSVSSSSSSSSSSVSSGSVTLTWIEPTTNTNGSALTDLAGYTVEYGTSPAELDAVANIDGPSTTTYTVNGLAAGTWYFAISAYASDGTQSVLSSVVSATVR